VKILADYKPEPYAIAAYQLFPYQGAWNTRIQVSQSLSYHIFSQALVITPVVGFSSMFISLTMILDLLKKLGNITTTS
jgi:hypothetical protein